MYSAVRLLVASSLRRLCSSSDAAKAAGLVRYLGLVVSQDQWR